jgi:hypothetical protein
VSSQTFRALFLGLGLAFYDLSAELQERPVDAEVSGVEVGAGPAESA